MASTATAGTIRLGPHDHGRRSSLHDFLDADVEEGHRDELARGALEVTKVPGEDHGLIVWGLLQAVARDGFDHPGLIHRAGGGGEFQLLLPGLVSGRHPDVAVVIGEGPKDSRGRRLPGLVMEAVSPVAEARLRDYRTKREEYLAYGLREYWVVDPIERRIAVLLREVDSWIERTFTDSQAAEGVVLPGVRVGVAELPTDPPEA